jgi:GDPmannose 4,6-dehydratase
MFVVSSTLFNHESSRRGGIFVTQKIASHVAKYATNGDSIKPLQLGNLNARRDWGHAKDYCEAIYAMLMQDKPRNFVIATGETHSVREFVELEFDEIGVTVEWQGHAMDEIGVNKDTGKVIVKVNQKYYRDIDIECLIGDSSKARAALDWSPSVSFKELVHQMVSAKISNSRKKID